MGWLPAARYEKTPFQATPSPTTGQEDMTFLYLQGLMWKH